MIFDCKRGSLVAWFALAFAFVACTDSTTTTTSVATTEPFRTVADAVMTINRGDYDRANALLDITALAEDSSVANILAPWDWIISQQRVATATVEAQETSGAFRRLFVVLSNDNYPG